jgi:hypothetical protein
MWIGSDRPDRVQVRDDTGSFSLVDGAPTEHASIVLRAVDAGGAAELTDPDGNRITLAA